MADPAKSREEEFKAFFASEEVESGNRVKEFEEFFNTPSSTIDTTSVRAGTQKENFGYGFASGSSLTEDAGNILETKVPLGRIDVEPKHPIRATIEHYTSGAWKQDFADAEGIVENTMAIAKNLPGPVLWQQINPRYVPPSHEFQILHDKWKQSGGKRDEIFMLNQLKKEKQARVDKRFEGVKIDKESWATTAGAVASIIADPTTLIPFGRVAKGKQAVSVRSTRLKSLLPGGEKVVVDGVNLVKLGEAMAAGGLVAGTEVGMSNYAQRGEVDWQDVAVATALGGALTYGLGSLGNKWRAYSKLKTDGNLPVSAKEIRDLGPEVEAVIDEVIPELDTATKAFNTRLGLDGNGQYDMSNLQWTGRAYSKINQAIKKGKKKKAGVERPKMAAEHDKRRSAPLHPKTDSEFRIHPNSDRYVRPTVGSVLEAHEEGITRTWVTNLGNEVEELLLNAKLQKEITGVHVPVNKMDVDLRKLEEDMAWRNWRIFKHKDAQSRYDSISNKRWAEDSRPSVKEQALPTSDSPLPPSVTKSYQTLEAIAEREAQRHNMRVDKYRALVKNKIPSLSTEETIADVRDIRPAVRNPFTGEVVQGNPGETTTIMLRRMETEGRLTPEWQGVDPKYLEDTGNAGFSGPSGHFYRPDEAELLHKAVADEASKLPSISSNRQVGAVTTDLASAVVGGAVGWHVDGPEGAVIGAALGSRVPWGAKMMGKYWRTKQNPMDWGSHANAAATVAAPKAVLAKNGAAATKHAFDIELAKDNAEQVIVNKLADMQVMLQKLGISDASNVIKKDVQELLMGVLQKEITRAPTNVVKAAKEMRAMLNQAVRDSMENGIISKKAGLEMLEKARTKGYWPRIYDDLYLSTTEGQEKFIKVLTEQSMSKEAAEDVMATLIGEKHPKMRERLADILEMGADGKPTGKYKFTPSAAKRALGQRKRYVAAGRSMHMERKRKLHVQAEEVLKPFLVSDPNVAMSMYLQDVYKQVEFARIFKRVDPKTGVINVDAKAQQAWADIEKESNSDIRDLAMNMYLETIGDPLGLNIKRKMEMKEFYRTVNQKASAIATLNLTFAQILNMGQATVNGSVLLSNYNGNPAKTFKLLLKSWWDTDKRSVLPDFLTWKHFGQGTEQGRVIGERSAAAFETTMMQMIGEMSNLNSTITGKNYAGGMLNPVNILNNPSTFLKFTGFAGVETFQRNLAANMGYHAAKDLLDQKVKILARPKINQRHLDRVNRHLKEMGINEDADPAQLIAAAAMGNDSQLLRAGLRFSNIANFRNNPLDIPTWMHNPYLQIFTKFKTFAFHFGKFLKDRVLQPAIEDNNYAPLAWYLGMAAGPGAVLYDLRKLVSGSDKEERENIIDRLADGAATVGGAGLWWTTLQSTVYGKEAPVMGLAGPTVNQISHLVHGGAQAMMNQEAYYVWRALLQTQVFPNKKDALEFLKERNEARNSPDRLKRLRRKYQMKSDSERIKDLNKKYGIKSTEDRIKELNERYKL